MNSSNKKQKLGNNIGSYTIIYILLTSNKMDYQRKKIAPQKYMRLVSYINQ